jgi:flavin reductase (DIM6/NTAB) family NADH-FMN oxidoreductase RutF
MSSETFPGRGTAVASDEFRRACGRFASGVTVATVLDAKGGPHGLTVSSFTAVSLHPPLVLICLGHGVTAIKHFRAAKHFGINILAEDQQALAERFARKAPDRFEGLPWRGGVTGVPLLPGVIGAIECAVHARVEMGDHDILVGEMVQTQVADAAPLVHFAGGYRRLEKR